MYPRIPIKTDLNILWGFIDSGNNVFTLTDKDVRLFLTMPRGKVELHDYSIVDEKIQWTFLGERQHLAGDYTLTISISDKTDGNRYSADLRDLFRLVRSYDEQKWDGGVIERTSRIRTLQKAKDGIEVDPFLSETSTNPVQNKVVTAELKKKADTDDVTVIVKNYVDSNGSKLKGQDGYSPTVDLVPDSSGVTIKVTDKTGTKSAKVLNGTGGAGSGSASGVTAAELAEALKKKQDVLKSGTNIKTVNGQSLLGSGNITIEGGSGGGSSSEVLFRYSSASASSLPDDPTVNASIWHVTRNSSDNWLAIGSTTSGSTVWSIIPLVANTEKTLTSTEYEYALGTSATEIPTLWTKNESDISGKPGLYLWTKTTYHYSDGTSEEICTPARCGINGADGEAGSTPTIGEDGYWYIGGSKTNVKAQGVDGKNGTSVTIRNTLASTADLPSSGATADDGYLIDGDLWVYTAASTTDATHIKGFTNVGQIKGDKGEASYVHFAWMNTLNNSDNSFSVTNNGSKYVYQGVYTDHTEGDSLDYTKYKWTKIAGTDGEKGAPGATGPAGTTYYLHVAWMNTANGGDFTVTNPGGAPYNYIGTCVDTKQNDPTSYLSYKWVKVKGADGEKGDPGTPGDDGITYYTHIAWMNTLDNSDNSFSRSKQAGLAYKYIGTCVDTNEDDPTDYTAYSWVDIKGDSPAITIGSNGNWFIDGVDSGVSSKGSTGPAITFAREYSDSDKTMYYYGNSTRCDVVYYNGKYWIANPLSEDTDDEGKFIGFGHKPGVSANWMAFGTSFNSLATGLFFAEEADVVAFNALVMTAVKAKIQELVVTKLMTAETGERVVTEGNVLRAYDSDGYLVATFSGGDDEYYLAKKETLSAGSNISASMANGSVQSGSPLVTLPLTLFGSGQGIFVQDTSNGTRRIFFDLESFTLQLTRLTNKDVGYSIKYTPVIYVSNGTKTIEVARLAVQLDTFSDKSSFSWVVPTIDTDISSLFGTPDQTITAYVSILTDASAYSATGASYLSYTLMQPERTVTIRPSDGGPVINRKGLEMTYGLKQYLKVKKSGDDFFLQFSTDRTSINADKDGISLKVGSTELKLTLDGHITVTNGAMTKELL